MKAEQNHGQGVGLNAIHEPLKGTKEVTWGLKELCGMLEAGEIDMDPEYQRGHVWTRAQQEAFVGHLLEGGAMPDVWMRELPWQTSSNVGYECVDGKQRLTALWAWWRGEMPGRLSAENGGREVWIGDLDEVELRMVRHTLFRIRVQVLVDYTAKRVLRLYLRLNRGGTPHSDAEIARVQALFDAAEDPCVV